MVRTKYNLELFDASASTVTVSFVLGCLNTSTAVIFLFDLSRSTLLYEGNEIDLRRRLEQKMNAASGNECIYLMAASDPGQENISATIFCSAPSSSASETRSLLEPRSPVVMIRPPTVLDIPAVGALFSEMQQHYRRPVTDGQAIEAATLACRPVQALFDPRVLVAVIDDAIVGSIVLNVTFPAFELSRSLYIRDLYVASSMRRHGIGQALVQAAAHLTYEQGFSAIDWTTETHNVAARQMYESCGARVLPRTYYRLAREDMTAEATATGAASASNRLSNDPHRRDGPHDASRPNESAAPGPAGHR